MTGKRNPLVVLETLVLIGIGGFAGSNLRFFVDGLLPGPEGTLLVNVAGSFALGFLLYEAVYSDLLAGRTQVVLGIGFLSSFTTYSTFVVEAVLASAPVAVAYVIASYAFGFAAVLVGRSIARKVGARADPETVAAEEPAPSETSSSEGKR